MLYSQHQVTPRACPFLPSVDRVIRPSQLRELKKSNDHSTYFLATLHCAQSLWLDGLPAQALLQLNFSLSLDIPDCSPIFKLYPIPYEAKVWIMKHRSEQNFLGNPVRHYQHLATRIKGRNRELRSLRAWVCFRLAHQILPKNKFPIDETQKVQEKVEFPKFSNLLDHLRKLQKTTEVVQLKKLYTSLE